MRRARGGDKSSSASAGGKDPSDMLSAMGIDIDAMGGGMGDADKVKKSDVDAVVKAALASAAQDRKEARKKEAEREALKAAEGAIKCIDRGAMQSAADAASSALALDAANDPLGAILQFASAIAIVADALDNAGVTARVSEKSKEVQAILRAVEGYITRSRELRLKLGRSGRQGPNVDPGSSRAILQKLAKCGYKTLSAGLKVRKLAIEAEAAGRFVEAYALYNEALDNFIASMKSLSPDKVTGTLKKVVGDTLDRAEAIAGKLKPNRKPDPQPMPKAEANVKQKQGNLSAEHNDKVAASLPAKAQAAPPVAKTEKEEEDDEDEEEEDLSFLC